MVMGHECVSKGLRMVLMQYDKQFRLHQRVEATYLNPSMAPRYRSIQDLESRQAMCTLMADDGSNFFDEFARYTSSIMYTLCFGIRLATGHEPEVKAVEEVGQRFMLAARPGTWIVDALPVLNHMPNFLAPWKRLADEWHKDEAKLFTDNMKRGLASQSWNWCKHVSQLPEAKRMSEEEIAYDFGTMFEAGKLEGSSLVLVGLNVIRH